MNKNNSKIGVVVPADQLSHRRFRKTLLKEIMLNGATRPEELVEGVLLKGNAHHIFCATGQGKTWVALHLVRELVADGRRVAYFDMENNGRIIADRLGDLAIEPDLADEYLDYYFSQPITLNQEAVEEYELILDEDQPELIVFDSWVGCLGAASLDENKPSDVEKWASTYVNKAKERGCTVLILDHVPLEGDRARGAGRKKELVDVQWKLRKTQPFDRETVGYIQLENEKDREASLPNKVGFSIGGNGDGMVIERNDNGLAEVKQGDGLSQAARTALETLESFGGQGATYTEWKIKCMYKGKPMSNSTFADAVKKLAGKMYHVNNRYYSSSPIQSSLSPVA